MKTYFAESNPLRQGLRRILTGASLILIGAVATLSQAASLSPVGQWDCLTKGGGQEGIAFLQFTTNAGPIPGTYALNGYELLAKLSKQPAEVNTTGRGVGSRGEMDDSSTNSASGIVIGYTYYGMDGYWSYDVKGNLVGYIYFAVQKVGTDEIRINAVSFSGKVSGKDPKKKLTMVSSTDFGKVTYKGRTLIAVTNASGADLVGNWNGLKTHGKQTFQEFFTLTSAAADFGGFPNIYWVEGTGPGYVYSGSIAEGVEAAGICVVSQQKKIGFDIDEFEGDDVDDFVRTNGVSRTSIGSYNVKRQAAKTKGAFSPYSSADIIKFNASKY